MSLFSAVAAAFLVLVVIAILAGFLFPHRRVGDEPAPPPEPAGPDRRAGGPLFREALLEAASATPETPARRRRFARRHRALRAAQAAHLAELSSSAERPPQGR